jgi:TetR/AcrR family transcriptional regulator, regulator of cefoperazone and chloramphenicol sensitivity
MTLGGTKGKLIDSAGQVFAEVGFHEATVREICSRAGTNVAAVNYHFRDKLGLYAEVLKSALVARGAAALRASMAQGSDPRAAFRTLVCEWFERSLEGGPPAWFARIMAHEMAEPTPGLDRVAKAMGPNYLGFRTLVGKLIARRPDDTQTRMCVHSVVGQVVHYLRSRPMLERLWPDLDLDDQKQRRAIANHIVAFSLAGMEGIAHEQVRPPKRKQQGARR